MGSTYCLVRLGFSQLYSNRPMLLISCSSGSKYFLLLPVAFATWSRVMGLRTFIFSAISAISSVTTQAKP